MDTVTHSLFDVRLHSTILFAVSITMLSRLISCTLRTMTKQLSHFLLSCFKISLPPFLKFLSPVSHHLLLYAFQVSSFIFPLQ